jgi:hypothetical protein
MALATGKLRGTRERPHSDLGSLHLGVAHIFRINIILAVCVVLYVCFSARGGFHFFL